MSIAVDSSLSHLSQPAALVVQATRCSAGCYPGFLPPKPLSPPQPLNLSIVNQHNPSRNALCSVLHCLQPSLIPRANSLFRSPSLSLPLQAFVLAVLPGTCPDLMVSSYQMAFLGPLSKPLSRSLASVSPFFSSFLDRLFCDSGHPQTYYAAGASHLVLLPPPPNCWITGASPKLSWYSCSFHTDLPGTVVYCC